MKNIIIIGVRPQFSSGSWKDAKFKEYNFDAMGLVPEAGYLHPLMKVRAEIRSIFLEMGFEEMATSNYVENSFWNFDTLFQPQQHPARDAHDTFFLSGLLVVVRRFVGYCCWLLLVVLFIVVSCRWFLLLIVVVVVDYCCLLLSLIVVG